VQKWIQFVVNCCFKVSFSCVYFGLFIVMLLFVSTTDLSLWPWTLAAVLLLPAAVIVFGVSVYKGMKNTEGIVVGISVK